MSEEVLHIARFELLMDAGFGAQKAGDILIRAFAHTGRKVFIEPMIPAEIEPKMMLANVEPVPAPLIPQPEPMKKANPPAPQPKPEPSKEMAPTPDPEIFLASLDAAVAPEPEPEIGPEAEIQVESNIELASYTPAARSVTIREVRPLSREEVRERVVYRKRSFTPISTL